MAPNMGVFFYGFLEKELNHKNSLIPGGIKKRTLTIKTCKKGILNKK